MAKDGLQKSETKEEIGKHRPLTESPRSANKEGKEDSFDEDHQTKRCFVQECLFNLFCCFLCAPSVSVKEK